MVHPSDVATATAAVPRWTAPFVADANQIDCPVPLEADLRVVADDCGVSIRTVVLAAHIAVLRILTGELPDLRAASWRELIGHAEHCDWPAVGSELWLRTVDTGLTLHSRSDVMTPEHLARIAGYHAVALRSITTGVDARFDDLDLLSEQEIQEQVHGIAGPAAQLDGRSFVDLFEERVRRSPDRPAVSHRGRSWSYRRLNNRANQIAHGLIDKGLVAEDVVAVVLERDLDWIAAMIGVLKAGGVYLPVPPGLPASRVTAQLSIGNCRFVLAESETATADRVVLSPRDFEHHATSDPGVAITLDQLAYLYFTSGSTGTPKGVLCEHGGMVNHLLMKSEVLELSEEDTVAQTAPQWLDISLWQSLAVLLVGGRVRVVDTGVLLEVDSFLAELAAAAVTVVQVVPSYFEVLASRLTSAPGKLRVISVTGEALRLDLVRRWFTRCPGVPVVNAYGATEVSDDTMHEILHDVPARPFVSVGRPGRNVAVYVLDEHRRLVPLGSQGEIAFSGVNVGRGYAGDEEGTRRVFVPDPYRPGARMYLTGDYGRWLPEGRIEFLGRRDQQVRIRGFRVEVGEVENGLLGLPGVRAAAVVVDGEQDRNRILVAFLVGDRPLDGPAMAKAMADVLPDYLVPTYFHQLDALPLNENGKVDRRALGQLASTLGHADSAHVAPRTPTERTLAQAWAEVLDVPLERIGRLDNFVQLGGTSLAAMWLVVTLDGLVSLRHVVRHPVLADLAATVDHRSTNDFALLQPLADPPADPVATLVCLPYAGGNAVNFQVLAGKLAPAGLAVYGVELPGHDLTEGEPELAGIADVAAVVADDVERLGAGPVLLWGHGTGAAHAIALARLLEERQVDLCRVFLAGALLAPADRLRAETVAVSGLTNQEIISLLLADSAYVEFDGLRREREALVGAAYRHDVRTANSFLIEAVLDPAGHRIRAGVDVVVAADDPATRGYRSGFREWAVLAGDVVLRELAEGGHYFTRTRPADVADLVTAVWETRRAHAVG